MAQNLSATGTLHKATKNLVAFKVTGPVVGTLYLTPDQVEALGHTVSLVVKGA